MEKRGDVMLEILYNNDIEVTVNTFGAELWSLKRRSDHREFLWQGDQEIWPRRAPLLFPITGALKDGQVNIAGRAYRIPMHGFARDYEHDVVSEDAEHISLRFTGNTETVQMYPYHYVLEITYRLEENRLEETACVRNIGKEPMYFSLGFHTGFICPPGNDGRADDCVIRFAARENCECFERGQDGLITGRKTPFLKGGDTFPLKCPEFPGTIILDHPQSSFAELANTASGEYVRVYLKGFPYLLFWANREEVPFLCIEPWYGLPDLESGENGIEEKAGILELAPSKNFTCTQIIEIARKGRASI